MLVKLPEKMKLLTIILAGLLIVSPLRILAQQEAAPATTAKQLKLMPVPASVEVLPGRLVIDNTFKLLTKDYSDARLQAGWQRHWVRGHLSC